VSVRLFLGDGSRADAGVQEGPCWKKSKCRQVFFTVSRAA
jgi:hypothetical protein